MEDIFAELPDLDISLLTNKKEPKTEEHKVSTTSDTGIFDTGGEEIPTEEELEDPKNPKAEVKEEHKGTLGDPQGGIEEKDDDDEEGESSAVKLIASFLKEKGVVDYKDEEFEDNDDFIANTVKSTIDTGVESGVSDYKETLPEEIKALIENYEDGVPLGQLLEHEQKSFELNSITEDKIRESSSLQEELVEAHLMATGWTKDETDERIKELQDAGIMEKWAITAHSKLSGMEKANAQAAIKQAQVQRAEDNKKYQAQVDQLKTTINDTKEFFEGVNTNDGEKKQVFEAITKYDKSGRNEISQLLNDPKNYLKVAYFLKVMKGDISKLKTSATTEAVKNIGRTIDSTAKKSSRFGKANLSTIQSFLNTKIK